MIQFIANLVDDLLYEKTYNATGITLSGYKSPLETPTCLWYNGATYWVGYKGFSTNHQAVIFKYKDGVIEHEDVGVGTATSDVLLHCYPVLLIINGFLYVFQTDPHAAPIKIWKSDVAESITDGFTLHDTITGDFAYIGARLLSDGRVVILSRTDITNDYSHKISISDVDDYTSWTTNIITDADYGVNNTRHYTTAIQHYNVNEWHYFGITYRKDAGDNPYVRQAIYKTKDYVTFYNLEETFSKDIVASGAITNAELETNFVIIGSISEDTTYTAGVNAVAIDDVLYNSQWNDALQKWQFMKIATDGTITYYDVPVSNIFYLENIIATIRILYNGNNLVFLIFTDEGGGVLGRKIYASDLNFDNFQFMYDMRRVVPTDRKMMPYNLDEVNGTYIIGGGSVEDEVQFYETDNRFII